MGYNYFYLPYYLSHKVNYIYLLFLYSIAERTDESKIKTDIDFTSFQELEDEIKRMYGPEAIIKDYKIEQLYPY